VLPLRQHTWEVERGPTGLPPITSSEMYFALGLLLRGPRITAFAESSSSLRTLEDVGEPDRIRPVDLRQGVTKLMYWMTK
jgi:hypothetical protein